MTNKHEPIPLTVAWSEEDDEWVATTPLYPSSSWLSPSPVSAASGIVSLVLSYRASEKDMP